ncbi:hypothetical protein [Hymenobacter busanensis]
MVGGTIGFSSQSTETDFSTTQPDTEVKTTRFNFAPQAGYFLADNLAVGLFANLANQKVTRPTFDFRGTEFKIEESSRTTQLGPFVRYYHLVGDEGKAGFFGQLAAGYQNRTDEFDTDLPGSYDSKTSGSGGFAAITPGFVFFPTEKFGLELTLGNLGFQSLKQDFESDNPNVKPYTTKTSGFDANFSLRNLSVGAFFYLGK